MNVWAPPRRVLTSSRSPAHVDEDPLFACGCDAHEGPCLLHLLNSSRGFLTCTTESNVQSSRLLQPTPISTSACSELPGATYVRTMVTDAASRLTSGSVIISTTSFLSLDGTAVQSTTSATVVSTGDPGSWLTPVWRQAASCGTCTMHSFNALAMRPAVGSSDRHDRPASVRQPRL